RPAPPALREPRRDDPADRGQPHAGAAAWLGESPAGVAVSGRSVRREHGLRGPKGRVSGPLLVQVRPGPVLLHGPESPYGHRRHLRSEDAERNAGLVLLPAGHLAGVSRGPRPRL